MIKDFFKKKIEWRSKLGDTLIFWSQAGNKLVTETHSYFTGEGIKRNWPQMELFCKAHVTKPRLLISNFLRNIILLVDL